MYIDGTLYVFGGPLAEVVERLFYVKPSFLYFPKVIQRKPMIIGKERSYYNFGIMDCHFSNPALCYERVLEEKRDRGHRNVL